MSKKILFQGDSVTDCGRSREDVFNAGLGSGYPFLIGARILADHLGEGYQIYNRGVSGNRVVDLYARWKIDALNLRPDIISILIGVNDTWHEFERQNGVEVERYAKFYRMLIEWTLEKLPEVKLVICEPFVLNFGAVNDDWLGEMAARGKVARELAREYKQIFVPFQSVLNKAVERGGDPALLLADGVHPTMTGHQVLADAWLDAAGKIL